MPGYKISFNVSYYNPNSGINNRLGDVLDSASFNKPGVEDIKPYLPSSPGLVRFQYDEDGNVIKDMTSGTDSVQWNIYGKATDIENRINKSKLHFVYDGAGQRVSKNQTITADSGYQYRNTYYVRDASGNILAEYKSRQEYKRRELRVTGWANIAVDIDPLITSIHEMGYDVDPAFKGSATTSGGGMSISYTPGHYLSSDAVLLQQVVSNNTDTLLKDLCTYGSSTNRYPAGDATMLSIAAGNEYQLTQLSQALFAEADAPTRSHALVQLAISMPDLYRELMSDLSIDTVSTPEDSTHIAEYMRSTNDSDPAYFPGKIEGYYISGVANPGVPNPVHRWVQLATADPLYYEGLFQEQGIVSMLSDNLVGYGLEAAALAAETNATQVADEGLFGFANGLSGAMDMILDHVSPGDLEQIEYDNDPPAYLRSLAQYAGASALDNALHAMGSTVEIAALYDRIVNNIRPGTTAGDMPSLDDGTPVLQLRQLDLSAHHLYGSSRLGIANYWPGQYSRIWNYTTKVVDTFRLGSGRPWYSGAYNDVIEREKTSPYGFGLQSPTLAQHVLGQKQYELSNHLGNVQATVSDARYVTGSGAGLKFKNSIVAAYDYYPFGMLMPDRFVTDTGQRSATVTQVVLAPKLVNTPVDMNVGVPDDSLYITWFPTIKYASGYGGNIHWTSSVVPQEPVEVTVDLRYVFGYTTVRVSEYVNGVWQIRANGFANYPGPVTLSGFTPTTNQIRISIGTDVMYVNSQVLFTLYSIGVSRMTMVPQLMATTIHNVDRDRYAFGFNGQLKDNEVAGTGNSLDFGARMYNSRIARWLSTDPLEKNMPNWSTYSAFGNNSILQIDKDGRTFTLYELNKQQIINVVTAMTMFYASSKGEAAMKGPLNSYTDYMIRPTMSGGNKFSQQQNNTLWLRDSRKTREIPHELTHIRDADANNYPNYTMGGNKGISEARAVNMENYFQSVYGKSDLRKTYDFGWLDWNGDGDAFKSGLAQNPNPEGERIWITGVKRLSNTNYSKGKLQVYMEKLDANDDKLQKATRGTIMYYDYQKSEGAKVEHKAILVTVEEE